MLRKKAATQLISMFQRHQMLFELMEEQMNLLCLRDYMILRNISPRKVIFSDGGFDCVLGSPSWERIKLREEEFLAPRNSEIVDAVNKSVREQMIKALKQGNEYDKKFHEDFIKARRDAEAASVYAHLKQDENGRFPITGIGDVNTYTLFVETILQIKHEKGRAGFIVPTGIATDDSTKYYFVEISAGNLVSLYDFENKEVIFPSVHRMFKFSLVSLGKSEFADICFFLINTDQLADIRRHFRLARDEFILKFYFKLNKHHYKILTSKW